MAATAVTEWAAHSSFSETVAVELETLSFFTVARSWADNNRVCVLLPLFINHKLSIDWQGSLFKIRLILFLEILGIWDFIYYASLQTFIRKGLRSFFRVWVRLLLLLLFERHLASDCKGLLLFMSILEVCIKNGSSNLIRCRCLNEFKASRDKRVRGVYSTREQIYGSRQGGKI